MEPNSWIQHDQQAVRLEGPDLTAARQSQILTSTKDISPNSIKFNFMSLPSPILANIMR